MHKPAIIRSMQIASPKLAKKHPMSGRKGRGNRILLDCNQIQKSQAAGVAFTAKDDIET